MATYGTDVPVTADDAAQVQKATRGAFADTGTVPAESFTAKVQSAADKNEAMKTDREDYVSLKEVLMQNPPLEEESREISKKIMEDPTLSSSSILTEAQYAYTKSKGQGDMLEQGLQQEGVGIKEGEMA